jgi:hypothetical protein
MRLSRSVLIAAVLALPITGLTFSAEAAPVTCKAKRAKKAKKAKKAKRAKRQEAVSARAITKWHKRGDSEDEIVGRVEQAGWVPSSRDEVVLKKARLPASLLAALLPTREMHSKAAPAPKVDLTKPAATKEIDFDAVAAPAGTPSWVGQKQAPAAAPQATSRAAAPAAQPAAPAPAATAGDAPAPTRRRVIVPQEG